MNDIDRHLLPVPDEVPSDSHDCPHAIEYGRTRTLGESVIRCGRCGAPTAIEPPPKGPPCSCQHAGGYDEECLVTGRCAEGKQP